MSDTSLALGVLKWAAIALGLGSALWGLLAAKPTDEDATGRKRLMPSGIVTISMIVGAAFISALSFGFETLAKQNEKATAELARQKAANEQRDRDALASATHAASWCQAPRKKPTYLAPPTLALVELQARIPTLKQARGRSGRSLPPNFREKWGQVPVPVPSKARTG